MIQPVSTPEAIAEIAAAAREIWTGHFTPLIGAEQVTYMLEKFQSAPAIRQQIDGGMIYLRLGGERIAGYSAYLPEADGVFLSKLYVRADARKQGWARRVLDYLENTVAPPRIHLRVNRHNAPAITAYHHLGFRITGEQKTGIGGGFVMDDYVMERVKSAEF